MFECSNKKTVAVLNCLPHLNKIIDFAVAISVERGFYPHEIHDVILRGERIIFKLVHQMHPSINTVVSIDMSFRDLIERPDDYMIETLDKERERIVNDNSKPICDNYQQSDG